MTKPRPVLPERCLLLTRRCTQRQFLMRPDEETNQAFVYCLAVAAQKYEIDVLFTLAMSNHHHTGIYDRHGMYPDFLAYFHKLFAKCQNALRGRWENFWSAEQTDVVEMPEAADVFEKMVYALANPVKDDLVEKAHHWPGVSSLNAILTGRPLEAKRPRHFFRPDGDLPTEVTLAISPFPEATPSQLEEWRSRLHERIKEAELGAAAQRQRTGARIVGRRGVLSQSWRTIPTTLEPRGALRPIRGSRRANKLFRELYAAAREAFRSGIRDVLFPAGTYGMRRLYGVCCAPP